MKDTSLNISVRKTHVLPPIFFIKYSMHIYLPKFYNNYIVINFKVFIENNRETLPNYTKMF